MNNFKNKTILLVEDNPDDEALTLRVLNKSHVHNEVVVMHDGVEALDYLFNKNKCNPLPQLVMLDLKLPKVDGLEVLRRIRAEDHTRLLPVIIFTSSKEEQDVIRGYTAAHK